MEDNKRTVSLPEDMYKQVEARLGQSDFSTVDEYIAFVVNAVLEKTAETTPTQESAPEEDDSAVRKRLQDLGYLG